MKRRGCAPRSGRPLTTAHVHSGAVLVALLLMLVLEGCSGQTYTRPTGDLGEVQRGAASWYGKKFHGRPTASGEIYDMYGLSAAHRTLPLGTVVEVTHVGNSRRVTVEINDRGPFVGRRIIDLSYGAARKLRMVDEGVAQVEVRVVKTAARSLVNASTSPLRRYTVQVGSYRDVANAERLRAELARSHAQVRIQAIDGWHRVQVGLYKKRKDAESLRRRLRRQGIQGYVVGI
ncbi:MAG: septal ring lytic transglycosylase RlpA family protein [Acidobacteriota bacterium]